MRTIAHTCRLWELGISMLGKMRVACLVCTLSVRPPFVEIDLFVAWHRLIQFLFVSLTHNMPWDIHLYITFFCIHIILHTPPLHSQQRRASVQALDCEDVVL